MSTFADRMNAQARIIPISAPNRVKSVMKLESGALQVTLQSGQVFDVDATDELFQSFVVYTVLADL